MVWGRELDDRDLSRMFKRRRATPSSDSERSSSTIAPAEGGGVEYEWKGLTSGLVFH
jgi:hypothetical protein